jgi:hypothetical protein
MKLLSCRPVGKGALLAFVTVELEIGLRLIGLPIFGSGTSGPWVGLPRKPRLDRERKQHIGANGKPTFEPCADWATRELQNKFSAAVIELVCAKQPDLFEDKAA